jgi:hypothetical protein
MIESLLTMQLINCAIFIKKKITSKNLDPSAISMRGYVSHCH